MKWDTRVSPRYVLVRDEEVVATVLRVGDGWWAFWGEVGVEGSFTDEKAAKKYAMEQVTGRGQS